MAAEPNYAAWKLGFDLLQWLFTIVVGIYVWLAGKENAMKKDTDNLKDSVTGMDRRVSRLEGGSIDKQDLEAMYKNLNAVAGEVRELTGELKGMSGTVHVIHDHLMNKGGKG